MSRNGLRKAKWARPATAFVAGLALSALPLAAQQMSGHSAGTITTPRPAPSRSFSTPSFNGVQRFGAVRPNSLGSSSAPPPSWELPRTVTPHWEIAPNIPIQPNAVQGNPVPRNRAGFGVGYVGLPYYVDPFSFGNAWNGDSDTSQQAPPEIPARSDYAPQQPNAQPAPYDEEYPAARAPYNPEAQQPAIGQSAVSRNEVQTNGLDHPAITLVFKDGRPAEKVRSYALTGSSIFVAEPGHQRTIPITDLDLPATIEQNREAGVDFQLPANSR